MHWLADWVTLQWPRRTLGACLMWPLHLLMRLLVAIRRGLYQVGALSSTRLPVHVLVVGNRIVGGAGKTPTVIAILAHLKARGHHPGLLSRGHGRQPIQPGEASPTLILDQSSSSSMNAKQVGDEPWLIWRRTGVPVGIDRDRARAGQALLARHPDIDILVCDDGLQHLALARDTEVVVFDERGAGNGWLLPAGPLREPIDAPTHPAMKAQPIVLYNAAQASTPLQGHLVHKALGVPRAWHDWQSGQLATPEPHAPSLPGPLQQADASQVWAVAGIAQPQRFFDSLRQWGLRFTPCPLPDHDQFNTLPWPPQAAHVVMTEKDAVKIQPDQVHRHSPNTQLWVAALDFSPEPAFWLALDARLPHTTPLKAKPPWTPD